MEEPLRSPRYAAFISYRHTGPDKRWAKWLHGALETYVIPKALVRLGIPGRLGRVFRDEEELAASPDLNGRIKDALDQSGHLIVVCSPRTPASRWVQAEIEHFRRSGGARPVLALLIEGDPSAAFPPSLQALPRDAPAAPADPAKEEATGVEPLAADVRDMPGESTRERKRAALLRLLAAMLDCRFDDLRQRDQTRQTHRLRLWALSATAAVAVVGAVGLYAEFNRRAAIVQRDRALVAQSRLLSDLSRQATTRGDARIGILLALEALPKSVSAFERPYVPAAESALYEALFTPAEVGALRGHEDMVRQAEFDHSGRFILTASGSTARLWNAETLGVIHVLSGHTDLIMQAMFGPDGKQIVTASSDGSARIWDATTGHPIHILGRSAGAVTSASFDRSGTRVATGSKDGTAALWDVASGKLLKMLRGHKGAVTGVVFSPAGDRLLTASADGTARLWDTTGRAGVVTLSGHRGPLNQASFDHEGARVVTASVDGTARIWDLGGHRSTVLSGHTGSVLHAVFSPDGSRVATAAEDGTGRVWDALAGASLAVLDTHELIVNDIAFSPNGERLVTGSGALDLGTSTARVWDATTGALRAVLAGHLGMVTRSAFGPDARRILTASYDGSVRLWSSRGYLEVDEAENEGCRDGMHQGTAPPHAASAPAPAGTPARAPDGGREAAAWVDAVFGGSGEIVKAIALRDAGPPTLVDFRARTAKVLEGHAGTVYHARFSADGQQIITASADRTARLWASDGTPLKVLAGHRADVVDVVFSPDGDRLSTSSWDGTARIWERASGTTLHVLSGHTDKVIGSNFSHDGHRLVTASLDGTARVWDVDGGQQFALIPGPALSLTDARFNPRGDRVILSDSIGRHRCVRLLADTPSLVSYARSLPLAPLTPDERTRYRLDLQQ